MSARSDSCFTRGIAPHATRTISAQTSRETIEPMARKSKPFTVGRNAGSLHGVETISKSPYPSFTSHVLCCRRGHSAACPFARLRVLRRNHGPASRDELVALVAFRLDGAP